MRPKKWRVEEGGKGRCVHSMISDGISLFFSLSPPIHGKIPYFALTHAIPLPYRPRQCDPPK